MCSYDRSSSLLSFIRSHNLRKDLEDLKASIRSKFWPSSTVLCERNYSSSPGTSHTSIEHTATGRTLVDMIPWSGMLHLKMLKTRKNQWDKLPVTSTISRIDSSPKPWDTFESISCFNFNFDVLSNASWNTLLHIMPLHVPLETKSIKSSAHQGNQIGPWSVHSSRMLGNAWVWQLAAFGNSCDFVLVLEIGQVRPGNVLPIPWFGDRWSCRFSKKCVEGVLFKFHPLSNQGARVHSPQPAQTDGGRISDVSSDHRSITSWEDHGTCNKGSKGEPKLPQFCNCSIILHPPKLGVAGNARRAKIGRSIPVAAPHSWAVMHQCDPESPPKHPSSP